MKNLLIITLVMFCPSAFGQQISFFKEDITFTLSRDHFTVDGFYWFANFSEKRTESFIYYPFGIGSEKEQVDTFEVHNITHNFYPKIINRSKNGFSFLLKIAGRDTVVYHIKYIQTITGDSARYILTSTNLWNRPLDHAEFKLIIGKYIELLNSSYEPDKIYDIESNKIYFWKKDNFIPAYDMTFHFKHK
ncbi:MAG: hypothetical protein JXA06_02030 [Bacteroidetes bacterium]|nr:hypothetical protein [Bacteroidota bacterium]